MTTTDTSPEVPDLTNPASIGTGTGWNPAVRAAMSAPR